MAAGDSLRKNADELRREAAHHRAEVERLERQAAQREAGAVGEDRVAAALANLDPAAVCTLHDRLLSPGRSQSNLDHIVVGQAGVFYIDAKNWAGIVNARDDSLWQHKFAPDGGRNVNQNHEVDKVRWLAEQMSLRAGCPVEPVLCLAGDRADGFGDPAVVRGVHVVPVNRIVEWLMSRPAKPVELSVRTLAVDLACQFPSAVDPGLTMQEFAAAGPPARPAPPPGRTRRRHATVHQRPTAGSAAAGKLAALILMLLTFVVLVPRILPPVANWIGHQMARRVTAAVGAASAAWTPPCTAVTTAEVQSAVHLVVYPIGTPAGDRCRFSYTPVSTSYAVPDVEIVTGWYANSYASTPRPGVEYTTAAGTASVRVGQFTAVPTSALAPERTTQPILVSVHYAGTHLTAAQARHASVVLAAAVAARLPTGPGSTVVRLR